MTSKPISWWRTQFGEPAIEAIATAIRQERVGQGPITQGFEDAFAKKLGMKHALVVTSGSVALYLALLAKDIKAGDEVIVPDRTWVASAHAPYMLGAKPILIDTLDEIPVVDSTQLDKVLTPKTKAIMPVHLNGRGCDMDTIIQFAKKHSLAVIEDACQALFSKHSDGSCMGTKGDAGCFSLGTTKLISSGQGGVIVTNDTQYYERLKLVKNHGVVDQFTDRWNQFGFNFKFTDFQSAMVHQQLTTVEERLDHLRKVYERYTNGLDGVKTVKLIPFRGADELPLYVDAETDEREKFIAYMHANQIQCRPFPPSLHTCGYLNSGGSFPNSVRFNRRGLYLPSGPSQSLENVDRVIEVIKKYS